MPTLETYKAGDVWVSSTTFENDNGETVSPSTVEFSYSIGGGPPVRFTYGEGGSPIILLNGLGSFSIAIDTSAFATATTGTVTVQYQWTARGVQGQGIKEGVILVHPPVIPLDLAIFGP